MYGDGILHAFCFIVVMVGIIVFSTLLWKKDIDHSCKLLTGGLICGWDLFNTTEGIIDHQLLKLHSVVESSKNHAIANNSFLGVLF
jgi:uncharacterized membrane protein